MSTHKVDNIEESTPGAGITARGFKAVGAGDSDFTKIRFAGSPFYDATHPTYGAKGQAGFDNRTALFTANAAVGQAGILQLLPDAASYEVASNLTIDCARIRCVPGARIKPLAGTTVTVLAEPDDANRDWMDMSGGGSFSFVGNSRIREYHLKWAVYGNGVTDDIDRLNWFTNCLPDGAIVVWGNQMRVAISRPWLTIGRSDITYKCEGFPVDAYLGMNKPTLKWIGVPGGTMACNYNSGMISYIGIFWDMQTAWVAIDQDQFVVETTNGSDIIHIAASNTGGANGASFLDQLPVGYPVRLTNGGPAAGQLTTTLAASIDGTHRHLAVAASSTVAFNGISFGQSAPSPQARISTQCVYFRNKILGGAGVWQAVGLQISRTTNANCEFNFVFENYITGNAQFTQMFPVVQNGGSYSEAHFNGAVGFTFAVAGGTMAAGSNIFSGFAADVFDPLMDFARIRVSSGGAANAGPNLTRGPLDGFMRRNTARSVSIFSDRACTIPLNAQVAVSLAAQGAEPHFRVGESLMIAMWVGPNFNAHKQVVKRNQFNFCNVGFRSDGGSFECENNFMTNNEIDHVILNNQAIGSSIKGDSSENSRQWATIRTLEPLVLTSCRFGAGTIGPSVGFLELQSACDGPIEVVACMDEGLPPPDSAIWNFSGGAGQNMEWRGGVHAHATTLAHLGLASLPSGMSVHVMRDKVSNNGALLPYEATFVSETSWRFNGLPRREHKGLDVYATQYAPVSADLPYSNSWAWFAEDDGSGVGFRERVGALYKKGDLSRTAKYRTVISGVVRAAVAAAGSYSPDLMAGDYFVLTMAGAFDLGVYAANSFIDGQLVSFRFYNNTGAPITITSHGIYHWDNNVLPTVPAAKSVTVTFRMDGAVMIEQSRNVTGVP